MAKVEQIESGEITPAAIAKMSDKDIGMHASGSYGPQKRRLFIECVRRMADKIEGVERGPFAA